MPERVSCRPFTKKLLKETAALLIAFSGFAVAAGGQQRAVDTGKSAITIRVYKKGLFSVLAHDHEIAAPVAAGSVDLAARRVEMRLRAAALRVEDPNVSQKDRDEIQRTMLGPEVLDTERFPEIVFRSTAADQNATDTWTVHGDLTLHGQTRPIVLSVRAQNGQYAGSTRLKQTDFGIKPVKVAGGTVSVKDEVRIDLAIQLVQ